MAQAEDATRPPPTGEPGEHDGDREPRGQADSDEQLPPDLLEAWRQLNQSGRSGLAASSDAFKAWCSLLVADVTLARSAAGRALALGALSVVFGGSAWLLLVAALMVFLNRALGVAWWVSLIAGALVSVVIAALAAWLAMRYFEHTRLQASRRQLARLGVGASSRNERDADATPP